MKRLFGFFLIILFSFIPVGVLYAQQSSDTATTRIGTPKGGDGEWPTSGNVTQGPKGPAGHGANGLVALDISNSLGTPIYATFDGVAYAYDCTNRGECNNTYGRLGNYVKLVPDSNPSAIVLFGHMMSVTITNGTKVKKGDRLGLMGFTGYVEPPGPGGTHLHYEFRGMPMAPPNIPTAITPETCGRCNPAQIP